MKECPHCRSTDATWRTIGLGEGWYYCNGCGGWFE